MSSHTVLTGFGERGRQVVGAMYEPQLQFLAVLDIDLTCAGGISRCGARSVIGNGADVVALREAGVPHAGRVIVTASDDMVALRVLTRDPEDLVLVERAVLAHEVGKHLSEWAPHVLDAVHSNGHRWRDQSEPHVLSAGDLLLELCTEPA
ncbi:TrkA-N domain-containing protein [Lentzea xinjiangensis]|uniref:TrkA-N domain-containing protein n=1 Tax=Lentzea xinjiangensis TaxID=402600 RepID=A0A1H9W8D9_9PSEU|nr:NAD-binding protein [Lentzea xinjiangensis]SES30158.1 TrkA-N domain-containing protein [Lentzea xinjiangensis]